MFAATVVAADELPSFVAGHPHQHDQLAVVSEVIEISREYRCFVRQGAFVCGSSYPLPPHTDVPAEVRGFAEDVAAAAASLPLDPLTVDVAITRPARAWSSSAGSTAGASTAPTAPRSWP